MIDKLVNSRCVCNIDSYNYDSISVMLPCEHLSHTKCIKNNYCFICGETIKKILNFDEINKKKFKSLYYYQIYVDMLSFCKYYGNYSISLKDLGYLYVKSPALITQIYDLMYLDPNTEHIGSSKLNSISNNLLDIFNIKIKIINKHKLIKDKKVIISNHSIIIDPIILYEVFKCTFLSATPLANGGLMKNVIKVMAILLIQRGKRAFTVNKIKDYFETHDADICIFPEGQYAHPNTLGVFRTGAFNVNKPIQPVIIKYDPPIYDNDYVVNFIKFLSGESTVTVTIMDAIYPPFNNNDIENIRLKMAKCGNLALSRVSNFDIWDS